MTTFLYSVECPECIIGQCSVTFDFKNGRAQPKTTKLFSTCGCTLDSDERTMLVGIAVTAFLDQYGTGAAQEAA